MNDQALEIFHDDVSNPLDSIEDMLAGNEWAFTRPTEDELRVHVAGKAGDYDLNFIWQDAFSAMQFFCTFDLTIPVANMDCAASVLRRINETMWLGHFDISSRSNAPVFRHTSLFRGWTQTSGAEHIEDLMEIALAESERYRNIFALLAMGTVIAPVDMDFILSDSVGEA